MNWLTRTATEVLDLTLDRDVLRAVGSLAEWLSKDGQDIAGMKDPISVLEELGRGAPDIRDRLAGAMGSTLSDLDRTLSALATVVTELQGRRPELRLLCCRWDRLEAGADEGSASVLRWNSVDDGRTSPAPVIDGITFGVSGMLDRGVLFEPKPQLTAELGVIGTAAVRVNLRGTIEASARADIPIRFGGIGLSAEGRGATILDWYVARGEDAFVASTIAAAIDALTKTHPFDIDALSRAFDLGRLLGVTIDASGGFGLGGSLTVGVTERLFGTAAGNIGAEVGFHSSRRGEFRLSVWPAGTDSQDRRAVRVDIRRTKVTDDTTSAGIGLTLDLAPLLVDLRPMLLEKAGDA